MQRFNEQILRPCKRQARHLDTLPVVLDQGGDGLTDFGDARHDRGSARCAFDKRLPKCVRFRRGRLQIGYSVIQN